MTQSLTDWLQQNRLVVVAVDQETGRLRVRAEGDACRDLSCHEATVVIGDDGSHGGLRTLGPGDIVRLDGPAGRPERIVVVRRAWEELTSPEF